MIDGVDDCRPVDDVVVAVVVVVVVVVVTFRRLLDVGSGGKAEVGGAIDGRNDMGSAVVAISLSQRLVVAQPIRSDQGSSMLLHERISSHGRVQRWIWSVDDV